MIDSDSIKVGKKKIWVSSEETAAIQLSTSTILSFCLGKNAVKFEVKAAPAGLMGRSIYITDFRESSFKWATKVLALRRAAKTLDQSENLVHWLFAAETEFVKTINSEARVLIGRFFHYKGSKRRRIIVFLLSSPNGERSDALLAETRIKGRWSFIRDDSYHCCVSGTSEVTEAQFLKEGNDSETETALLTLTGEKNKVEVMYRDRGLVKKMILGRVRKDYVLELEDR